MPDRLAHRDLLQLQRLATPTVANGWEQITTRDGARECFNLDETRDFLPEAGPMVGYAATLVIEPSDHSHTARTDAWDQWYDHVAAAEDPTIVVVQDLDSPNNVGAFWGEVNSTIHRALGCVGTITDGGVRDLDEMRRVAFKALARRTVVGHAHVHPVRWDEPVVVFGCRIEPGQLVHADQHGFLAIPREDEGALLDACLFMDDLEQASLIDAARQDHGGRAELLAAIRAAERRFGAEASARFGRAGEFGAAEQRRQYSE